MSESVPKTQTDTQQKSWKLSLWPFPTIQRESHNYNQQITFTDGTGYRMACRSNSGGKSYTCDYANWESGDWAINRTDCKVCERDSREASQKCIVDLVKTELNKKAAAHRAENE